MGGLKGEARHLSIESSISGASIVSTFFGMGQSNWLIAKKQKLDLWGTPQLIGMKQNNKYPQWKRSIFFIETKFHLFLISGFIALFG